MDNLIVIGVVALVIGLAVWYIRKEKRRGVQCVGCPESKTCSGQCAGCGGGCGSSSCINH